MKLSMKCGATGCLFIATNKWKYIQLTIRFQYVLSSLDPEVVDIFNKHRFFSFSGKPATAMPWDGLNELVNMLIFCI